MGDPNRDLAALPKAHLHVHLAGAARPETYVAIAETAGLPAPVPEPPYTSFTHFQTTISAVVETMRTPEALARVTREVVEDAASAGAVWIELALETGQAAAEEAGVGFGLVVAANRVLGPEEAVVTARMAAKLAGSGVVGL